MSQMPKRFQYVFSFTRNLIVAMVFCATAVAFSTPATAQSVDLPIPNIPQETDVWCWAAVAQQIIFATVGRQNTPPQCALVAMGYGADPAFCCNGGGYFNGNQQCRRTGSFQQIQGLIAQFGGRYSSIAPPADPYVLFDTLEAGRAIILQIRTSPYSNHVVVLRGMSWINGTPVLHINDPLAYFTQRVAFQQLLPYWSAAVVVY